MSRQLKSVLYGIFVSGLIAFGLTGVALADGTASGTSIDNLATVDYDVDGVAQTEIESSPSGNSTAGVGNGTDTSFVVDNKVDLTVATTDGAAVAVTPGDQDQVLTYTVTNDGNTVQDYSLTVPGASGTWGGATDNFDATSVNVYVDANANDTYDSGTDTATYIDELAADAEISVFVVGDIPLAQSDDDGALYDLIAQTAVGGTGGSQGADITTDDAGSADVAGTVQIVFADGAGTADAANDGKHSSRDGYLVQSAAMTVTKTSAVVSDPINGTTNPKAIPGATMRYTITVANAGNEDADDVTVVDTIPTNTTYVAGTLELDSASLTDGADADEGDYNVTNAGAVTIVISAVAASGGSSTITFDVTVD